MAQIYKLKQGVVQYIISLKYKHPEISCRTLALEASKKFGIKLSKSSVNNIIIKEKLSCPVGRRTKQEVGIGGEIEYCGYSVLRGVDYYLDVSKTAAEVLINLVPSTSRILLKDAESVIQGLIIFKSIFDVTLDFTNCYNNKQVWALIGRRPTKTAYNRIIKMIQSSQLFVNELVRELRKRLMPISGFRFQLRDDSSFFVDAGLQTIWQTPVKKEPFFTTYYRANSYINKFISYERVFSVFNILESSIFSPEILNFIVGFDSQDSSRQIKQIELLDPENNIVDNQLIRGSEKRLFLLGFWPWQLEIMSEFERKPAEHKLTWSDFRLEYYYQIEEVSIPQHLVAQDVRLIAIILKNSPLGAARFGILTNIPRDIISNFLSYKELYHWVSPEDRYKDFIKKSKWAVSMNVFSLSSTVLSKGIKNENPLDEIFQMLSQVIFHQFQQRFLPQDCSSWDPLKVKEVFLRQKGTIKRSKESTAYNLLFDKELCKESDLKYICQRLNEQGIRDGDGRMMIFK